MSTREEAEKLFKSVNTFIISCVGEDGYPLTKAVVPGKYRESLNEMYFCTNTSSHFAAEISKNPKACVYFFTRKLLWKGCQLRGNMEIVTDMAVKEKYWDDAFKNAYPQKSFTDPDFCVLKFMPVAGNFYAMFKPQDFEV